MNSESHSQDSISRPSDMFWPSLCGSPCVYMDSLHSTGRSRQRQRNECTSGLCLPVILISRVSSMALWLMCGQESKSNMVRAKELAQPNVCAGEISDSDYREKKCCALFCIKLWLFYDGLGTILVIWGYRHSASGI